MSIEDDLRLENERLRAENESLKKDLEIEKLRAENEDLKKVLSKGVSLKISEKGGLSIYGLGRFPVTLYKEQWVRLLDMAGAIKAFIKSNENLLKAKTAATQESQREPEPPASADASQ
jgi:hypothetical protein